MPPGDRQRLIGWVRGRAVLTVTDDDPACLYGAMVCLARRPAGLGFSVNLDAIGRGPLRVDPRVLQIGRGGEDASLPSVLSATRTCNSRSDGHTSELQSL